MSGFREKLLEALLFSQSLMNAPTPASGNQSFRFGRSKGGVVVEDSRADPDVRSEHSRAVEYPHDVQRRRGQAQMTGIELVLQTRRVEVQVRVQSALKL